MLINCLALYLRVGPLPSSCGHPFSGGPQNSPHTPFLPPPPQPPITLWPPQRHKPPPSSLFAARFRTWIPVEDSQFAKGAYCVQSDQSLRERGDLHWPASVSGKITVSCPCGASYCGPSVQFECQYCLCWEQWQKRVSTVAYVRLGCTSAGVLTLLLSLLSPFVSSACVWKF
jgi:hypothetical protein